MCVCVWVCVRVCVSGGLVCRCVCVYTSMEQGKGGYVFAGCRQLWSGAWRILLHMFWERFTQPQNLISGPHKPGTEQQGISYFFSLSFFFLKDHTTSRFSAFSYAFAIDTSTSLLSGTEGLPGTFRCHGDGVPAWHGHTHKGGPAQLASPFRFLAEVRIQKQQAFVFLFHMRPSNLEGGHMSDFALGERKGDGERDRHLKRRRREPSA